MEVEAEAELKAKPQLPIRKVNKLSGYLLVSHYRYIDRSRKMDFFSAISNLWGKKENSILQRAEDEFSKTIYGAMKDDFASGRTANLKDGNRATKGRSEKKFLEDELNRAFAAFEAFMDLLDTDSDDEEEMCGHEKGAEKEAIEAIEAAGALDFDGDCKPVDEGSESVTTLYYAFDDLLISADATHVIANRPTPQTVIIGDINDDINAEWDDQVGGTQGFEDLD